MSETAYETWHSVDAEVSSTFAWDWRTQVENWHDPPARFHLDGPFAAGSWGTTYFPGQEPLRWQIRAVSPYESFTIEMPLDGATLSFEWRFDGLADRRTRLTQHIRLSGTNAAGYVEQVRAGFNNTLRAGMERIAKSMSRAHLETRGS